MGRKRPDMDTPSIVVDSPIQCVARGIHAALGPAAATELALALVELVVADVRAHHGAHMRAKLHASARKLLVSVWVILHEVNVSRPVDGGQCE